MENSIPKWLLEDNDKRSGAYSRDLNDEHFLREMNQRLREDNNSVSSDDSKPIIFSLVCLGAERLSFHRC